MRFHPSVIHRVNKQVARIRPSGCSFDSWTGSSLTSSQASGTDLNIRQILIDSNVINVPFSAISGLSYSLDSNKVEADSTDFGLPEGLLETPCVDVKRKVGDHLFFGIIPDLEGDSSD